jgi:hypothetical protein
MIFYDIGRYHLQKETQGMFVSKLKVAQHFEVILADLHKRVLTQVVHKRVIGPPTARDTPSNRDCNYRSEAAPEFDPQFRPQGFIFRGEKKPHQLLVGIVLVRVHCLN